MGIHIPGGLESSELLWEAAIDGAGAWTFFDEFDDRVDNAGSNATQAFDNIDRSAQKSGREIGAIAGAVAGVTAKLTEMGLAAIASIGQFISGSIQLRARVDTLGTTLDHIAGSAGYTAEQIAQVEEELRQTGITTQASRQSMLRMIRANIDLAESAKLARVAQNAAVVAGINSSQAFERLVLGIQRREPELLDELGITLSRADAYEKFAATVGKSTKELNSAEQQQAILDDIYRQSVVVMGAYENAMGLVGKQATSLPRYIEELQLAIGGAFQPAYTAQVGIMTEQLKEMTKWFEENEEQVVAFGEGLGEVVVLLFDLLKDVSQFASSLPDAIEDVGIAIAKIIGAAFDIPAEDIEARRGELLEWFGQAVTMLVGFAAMGLTMIGEVAGFALDNIRGLAHFLAGEQDAARQAFADANQRVLDLEQNIQDAFENTIIVVGDALGVVEEIPGAMEAGSDAADGYAESLEGVEGAASGASAALRDLIAEMRASAEESALKEQRRRLEEELRMSQRIEAIERRSLERIQNIRERAAEEQIQALERMQQDERNLLEKASQDRFDLEEDRAWNRIDIEQNYQERLQDIKRQYGYDAEEAIRKRDAITLLRLRRGLTRQLDEAGINRDRQKVDEDKNYQRRLHELNKRLHRERVQLRRDLAERLEELRENLDEQLEAAEEQRIEEYTNLKRGLEEKEELRDLHRRFEEQDRRRAMQQEVMDVIRQHGIVQVMTSSHLFALLGTYRDYFQEVYNTSASFVNAMNTLTSPGGGKIKKPIEGKIGQAGLVSSMLAAPTAGSVGDASAITPVSRVPAVASRTSRSVERRELAVTVGGDALEPYIQRVLVQSLLEIERNRG